MVRGEPAMQGQQIVENVATSAGVVRSALPPSELNEEWVLAYINFLEREEPVDRVILGGLHLWPWIRFRIFQQLLTPSPAAETCKFRRSLREKTASTVRRLSGQTSADWAKLRKQSQALRDADLLFYSYIPNYQVNHDGLYYDRVLDPICEFVGDKLAWQKFHVRGWQAVQDRAQVLPGTALSPHCAGHLPLTPGPRAELKRVGMWLRALEGRLLKETGVRVRLGTEILRTAAAVRRYRGYFRRVLDGARAKAVLIPCYYGERQSGLIWACRDLGITTIDVQHGKQGILSMGYGQWPRVADGGYVTMPDMFWVWGQESAENLKLGSPGQVGMPEVRVTGNMYVGQWVRGTPADYRSADPKFWDRADAAERVVLVTLQPYTVARAVPPALVTAMRESPDGWLWVLRIHPAGRPSAAEIDSMLRQNAVQEWKYTIQGSSAHPLYALMKHSAVHVTLWSSCGYEALCFNVPTIFLDDFAGTLYQRYLKKGLFHLASSAAEIREKIGSAPSGYRTAGWMY